MTFSKFISFVFGVLGSYYFIIILFDVLKSNNKIAQVTTHVVQFDTIEKPEIVSSEPQEILQSTNTKSEEDFKKYLPPKDNVQTKVDKKKSPLIDLGLETISGDAYTVNGENLSKFMIA